MPRTSPITQPLIRLDRITKSYITAGQETEILHGISLTVGVGEFVAIMGQSGSGKSTLMNIIGLLDTPTTGAYMLAGEDVSGLTDDAQAIIRGQRIGFVFQSYNLLPRMTALEQVMLPLMYQNVSKRERIERAREALTRVGLGDRIDNTPNQLSGGQMQRVAVARALVTRADLILADEPTGALDSVTSREMMHLLTQLNDEGHTIILITHDPEIAKYGKRHIRIADGNIVT